MDALMGYGRLPALDDIGSGDFHRCFDDKVACVHVMADAHHRHFGASFRLF